MPHPDNIVRVPEIFSFDEFEDRDDGDIIIRNPLTGAPTPFVITLAGPEHPLRRTAALQRQRRMRAQMAKTGKMDLGDPEEDELQQTDDLVAWTLGWRGIATPYSKQAARDLYTDPKRRWLREQVIQAMADRDRFIRRSEAA